MEIAIFLAIHGEKMGGIATIIVLGVVLFALYRKYERDNTMLYCETCGTWFNSSYVFESMDRPGNLRDWDCPRCEFKRKKEKNII